MTQAWYLANAPAAAVQAAMMLLSVGFLAIFVAAISRISGPGRRSGAVAGTAAVVAIVVSSVITGILSLAAGQLSSDTVGLLRYLGFLAGGVVHVTLLGIFVLVASRGGWASGPIRVFAIVVAVPAVLSIISTVFYYASILILAGRLLGMIWCVVAAVSVAGSVWRRSAADRRVGLTSESAASRMTP